MDYSIISLIPCHRLVSGTSVLYGRAKPGGKGRTAEITLKFDLWLMLFSASVQYDTFPLSTTKLRMPLPLLGRFFHRTKGVAYLACTTSAFVVLYRCCRNSPVGKVLPASMSILYVSLAASSSFFLRVKMLLMPTPQFLALKRNSQFKGVFSRSTVGYLQVSSIVISSFAMTITFNFDSTC